MKSAVLLFVHFLVLIVKVFRPGGIKGLIAENLILKHQLTVLSRTRLRAPNLKATDRIVFGLLSLVVARKRTRSAAVIIKPSTLLRFHRALVKRAYRRLFSNTGHTKPGPKGPSRELITAIVELKQRNPSYGCPRIAYIISLTFGIEINKDVIRRVLGKHYKPKPGNTLGASWLSLLGHSKDSWRIIGFGIHPGDVDGVAVCRMFNHAISGSDPPGHLSSDNDPLFRFHRWQANLRVLEVEEIKSVPYAPMSHPIIERLIGTIRREYLDHVLCWNSLDLERKLGEFKNYYNSHRTHSALSGQSPEKYCRPNTKEIVHISSDDWQEHCRGLFYTPIPA